MSAQNAAPHRNWWMLATSLLSVFSLYLVTPVRHPAIPLLAVVMVIGHFVRWRLPSTGVVPWVVRALLFGVIFMTAPEGKLSSRFWYLDEAVMNMVGMLLEAELAVEFFLPHSRMRLGQMLILTSGIFAAGTLTFEQRNVAVLAPLFAIGCMGVLRQFKPSVNTSPAMNAAPPGRGFRRWLLHGSVLVLALTLGFGEATGMRIAYEQFGRIGVRLIQKFLPQRSSGGIAGDEQLRGSFNPTASTGRTLRITGINRAMHLRGLAFDRYALGSWQPQFTKRLFDDQTFSIPANVPTFQVERLQDSLDILYLPLSTSGFATPGGTINQVEPGHRSVVRSVTEGGEMLVYSVAVPSPAEIFQGPLCRKPTDAERADCLAIPPELLAGVHDIARSLHDDNPKVQIRKIVAYLQDNHHYSLESGAFDGDPVSDFLVNKKDAHCQFFAASAVMLMRLNGIPSRYVTGYFAHEATGDNSMVVRGRDAHAWAEAWLDDVGWVTVEATPASGTPPAQEPVSLFQRLKDGLNDLVSAIGGFIRSLRWHHIAIAGGAVLLGALLLQVYRNWQARRRIPRIRAYAFPTEQFRRLATQFEMELKQIGDAPSGAATWTEHLREQSAQTRRSRRQARLEAARRFVEEYNKVRFGEPADGAAVDRLTQLLKEVKER